MYFAHGELLKCLNVLVCSLFFFQMFDRYPVLDICDFIDLNVMAFFFWFWCAIF